MGLTRIGRTILVTASILSLHGCSQLSRICCPAPPTYSPKSLGAALQKNFRELQGNCGLQLKCSGESSIPLRLRNLSSLSSYMNRPVEAEERSSANSLFRKVCPDSKPATIDTSGLPELPGELLVPDVDLPVPEEGTSHTGYLDTCTTLLKASLDAKVTPPQSEISAALRLDDQNRESAAVVEGRFTSPLSYTLLSGSVRFSTLLRSLLYIWQFYETLGTEVPNPPGYFVSKLDGLAYFHLVSQSSKTTFDINTKAGASWLVASINGSASAQGNFAVYRGASA